MVRLPRRLAALALGMAALGPTAAAADERIVGEWITQRQSARIAIAACAGNPSMLCGRIAWLAQPLSADGAPASDGRNPDASLQGRAMMGLQIMQGFRAAGADRWNGGTIYDPESGRTYSAHMRLSAPGMLEVKGCVLVFCETQIWRRPAARHATLERSVRLFTAAGASATSGRALARPVAQAVRPDRGRRPGSRVLPPSPDSRRRADRSRRAASTAARAPYRWRCAPSRGSARSRPAC
jgi:uncharacterized protein (DUF2147 family)